MTSGIRVLSCTAAAIALAAAAPLGSAAQTPSADEQIRAAVLPLPESERPTATVMGYRGGGALQVLRRGSGNQICIADAPGDERFHVACYHESLEPFMRRGRELTAQGIVDPERDRIRAAEAEAGTLSMPDSPASLSSLTGRAGAWDAETGELQGAQPLHVVYIPWATQQMTGLPVEPATPGQPWLMFPGSYRAHIMVMPPPPGGGR